MTVSRLKSKHANYTLVPNEFLGAKVTHEAFRLYVVLLSHAKGNAARGGVVFPGYDSLGEKTGIKSYSTIAKCIRELESTGWLERKKRFGASTIYTLCSPTPGVAMDTTPRVEMEPPITTPDVASVLHGVAVITTPDVGQSYTPSQTNKTHRTKHIEQNKEARASAPRPRDAIFDAVAQITKSNPKLNASMIAKVANQLKAVDATPEQVLRFGKWWAVCDWRGLRGDLPLLNQITPLWQRSVEWDGARPKLPTTAPPRSNGRTFARGQVQYTDEQRKAAEERARRQLAGEEVE